jgi:hypothetical protein
MNSDCCHRVEGPHLARNDDAEHDEHGTKSRKPDAPDCQASLRPWQPGLRTECGDHGHRGDDGGGYDTSKSSAR